MIYTDKSMMWRRSANRRGADEPSPLLLSPPLFRLGALMLLAVSAWAHLGFGFVHVIAYGAILTILFCKRSSAPALSAAPVSPAWFSYTVIILASVVFAGAALRLVVFGAA